MKQRLMITTKDSFIDNKLDGINCGLMSGNAMKKWVEDLVPDYTFLKLYENNKFGLKIIGSNLTTRKAEVFDHITHPNMKIRDALMISMAVPFLYDYREYNGNIYVDGALFSPFPIEYATKDYEVVGIEIINKTQLTTNPSYMEFCNVVIQCLTDKSISHPYYTLNLSIPNEMQLLTIKKYSRGILTNQLIG